MLRDIIIEETVMQLIIHQQ